LVEKYLTWCLNPYKVKDVREIKDIMVFIGVNLRKKPEFSKKRKEGCRERKKLK